MTFEMITLGDLTLSTRPICYGVLKPGKEDPNGIPLIRVTDISSNYFDDKNLFKITPELDLEFRRSKLKGGEILLSIQGTIGKVAICPEKYAGANISRTIAVIDPDDRIVKDYLKYYFIYLDKTKKHYSTGSTRASLNISYLRKLKIPIPNLETQKRIAANLDDAQALKQKTEKLLAEYDDLAQSIFLDMFGDPVTNPKGWKTETLGEICGVGSSKRVFVDELVDKGVPFYRGTEVGKLGENQSIEPSLFIAESHYNKLKEHRGVPKIGDLLMPSICPDGRIWKVNDPSSFYFKDGRVLWIDVNLEKINSDYLRFFLKGLFFANYSNIASGTTFAELKIVALKKIKVLSPPLNIQTEFADKVALIEQQKDLAKQELKESEDLFNCLLQKAFKGELN